MSYRKIANLVADSHNQHGGSIVSISREEQWLTKIADLQLRVPQDAWVVRFPTCHLTPRQVRRAFWELRKAREWKQNRGVVFSTADDDHTVIGLGVMVPPTEPMPALTKMDVIGGEGYG